MKRRLRTAALALAGALVFAALALPAQEPAAPAPEPPAPKMKQYFVAFLYKGPSWTPESTPATAEIQERHMANIGRLAAAGKLVLAGPFADAGDLRGLFVLDAATLAEARALCDSDPAIQAGRLRAEVFAWWTQEGRWQTTPAPAPATP